VLAALSALIMAGTVGKIIADSRRETAVFRAIGAKRIDIAEIYLLYCLMVAGLITLFSVGVGLLLASWFNSAFSGDLTVEALIAFNSTNLDRQFTLLGFDAKDLGLLAAIIVAASLISAALPLLTNLKRNPINDMRDDR